MSLRLPLLLVLVGVGSAAFAAPKGPVRHAVLIVVDGLTPEAIEKAPAPAIRNLFENGAHSLRAEAAPPLETVPNLVSLVTGKSPAAHRIAKGGAGVALPVDTLFTQIKAAGGRSGFYYGKSQLAFIAPDKVTAVRYGPPPSDYQPGGASDIAARWAEEFPRERFMFTLLHLRDPDLAGHDHGWMSDAYLAAVRRTDSALRVIRDGIASARAPVAVFLTADHGGGPRGHFGTEEGRRIPWVCMVPGGSKDMSLREPVHIVDTAPTLLAVLGLPALQDTEGRVIKACLPRR